MEINPKLVKGLSGAELHVTAETVGKPQNHIYSASKCLILL
jgi:hypothetical protein